MKVLKAIMIAAIFVVSFNAQAGNDSNDNNRVQQRVATALSQTGTDLEGAVNVKFTLEPSGKLNVVSVESSTSDLKDVVEDSLTDLRFKAGTESEDNVYNMNFIFHQEENVN